MTSSTSSQTDDYSTDSSSGSDITTLDDAAADVSGDYSDGETNGSEEGSSSGSSTSPLLQGEMSFEELVGEICNGIDLIFATKRSTVVVTDYESIYAEAKYLRDHNHQSYQNISLQQHKVHNNNYQTRA